MWSIPKKIIYFSHRNLPHVHSILLEFSFNTVAFSVWNFCSNQTISHTRKALRGNFSITFFTTYHILDRFRKGTVILTWTTKQMHLSWDHVATVCNCGKLHSKGWCCWDLRQIACGFGFPPNSQYWLSLIHGIIYNSKKILRDTFVSCTDVDVGEGFFSPACKPIQ